MTIHSYLTKPNQNTAVKELCNVIMVTNHPDSKIERVSWFIQGAQCNHVSSQKRKGKGQVPVKDTAEGEVGRDLRGERNLTCCWRRTTQKA